MELCADAEMAPRLARALFIHRSMKCHTSAVMNRHTSLWTQGVIQQGSIGVFTRLQPVTPTARAGLVGWWPHCRTGGGQKLVGWWQHCSTPITYKYFT